MPQQYGLRGTESALMTGAGMGIDQLADTQQQVATRFDQGIGQMTPFAQTGQGANQLQAQLSGAMGADAQQQAMSDFQSSPFYDQAQQNAERAITRNASATGSLGSGNVLDQLYQNAAGMFMQDYNQRFNQLGQVADRGVGAASSVAQMRGNQAGIESNLGQTAAQIPVQTGSQIGQYRMQAGRDIADQTAQTTSSLANLINQQGAGVSDMVSGYTNNVNQLYQAAAQGDAQAKEQLSTMLSNLATQTGTQYSSQPLVGGAQSNMLGQVGQISSGIGAMLPYMNQGGNQQLGSQFQIDPSLQWLQQG